MVGRGVVVGARRRCFGPKALVVDAVGNHEDTAGGSTELLETRCGPTAHAHDGIGAAGRHGDGPTEHDDLAPLVPLGMVEEREVVDGDDARDPGALGHRVVRTVVHVDRLGCDQTRKSHLLPDETGRSVLGSAGAHHRARRCAQVTPASPVTPTAPHREGDVGARHESRSQIDRVATGTHRLGRDGTHIEREREHRGADIHRSELHNATWARAADSHVRLAARARLAGRGQPRPDDIVGGHPDEGLGDVVDAGGVHLERSSSRGGQGARHHRRAIAHGFDGGKSESLFEGHVGEQPGPGVQRRQRGVPDASGEHDALPELELRAPPRRSDDHQRPWSGELSAGHGVGLEQTWKVLARFEGPDRQEELVPHPEARQEGGGLGVVASAQDVRAERDHRDRTLRRPGFHEVAGHDVGGDDEMRRLAQGPT